MFIAGNLSRKKPRLVLNKILYPGQVEKRLAQGNWSRPRVKISCILPGILGIMPLFCDSCYFRQGQPDTNSMEVFRLREGVVVSNSLKCLLFAAALFLLVPSATIAENFGSDQLSGSISGLDRLELLSRLYPLVPPQSLEEKTPPPMPGMTFGTPTAYGANWRQAFVGLSGISYLDNTVNDNDVDGSMSFGAGFGDAASTVGFEASVGIISLTDEFADSGSVGLKLHKILPDTDGVGVALGWSNALNWGDAKDAEDTIYAVASKSFVLRPEARTWNLLSASLGVGTGTFRTVDDIVEEDNNLNVFGSLGVLILPQLSLATSWTGSQLNVGVGLAPFDFPLTATMGFNDVTEEKALGAGFSANVGYSFSF